MRTQFQKILPFLLIVCNSNYSIAQTQKKAFKTSILSGTYQYGKNVHKNSVGLVTVYPESDSTILFYLDLNRGAPSYNMGQLYGRLKVDAFKGLFYSKTDSFGISCKFLCEFKGDRLIISVIDSQDSCGFGYGVYPD